MVEEITPGEQLLKALRRNDRENIKALLQKLTSNERQYSEKESGNNNGSIYNEDFKILAIFKDANLIVQKRIENHSVLTCCCIRGRKQIEPENDDRRICCIVGKLLEMELDDEAKTLLDHCVLSDGKYFKIDDQFLLHKKNRPCRQTLKRIYRVEGSDDHPLQTHPVVLYLLKSRWYESCFFTLSTAIVQLTFCIHLANYVMRVQAGCGNASNCSITQELCKNNSDCSKLDCAQLDRNDEYYRPSQFSVAFLLVSALLLFSHEVLQVIFQYRKLREKKGKWKFIRLFGALKNYFFDLENLVQLAVILAVFSFVIIPGLFHQTLYSHRSINSTTGLNGQDITSLHAAPTLANFLTGVRTQPTSSCSVKVPTTCDVWNNSLVEPLAITILIATLLLVGQLRKLGTGGEFVFMLKKIARSYLTHSMFITLAVFGFAIAFQMIIRVDSDLTFRSIPHAFLRTLAMFTGEYDYVEHIAKEADNKIDYENPHNSVAGPMFAVFLVVMVIIVQNLLTGVALEDVRAVHLSAVKQRLRLLVKTDREIWYFMALFTKAKERFLKSGMEKPNHEKKDESSRVWDVSCYAIFIAYPVTTILLIWAKSCCEIEYLTEHYKSKTVSIETFYNIIDYGLLLAFPIFLIVYPLIIPYYRLWRKIKTTTARDEKAMHFIGREELERLEENILKNLGASIMSRKQSQMTINDAERMEKRMKVWMEALFQKVNRKEMKHSAIQTDEQPVSLERRTTSQSEIDKLLSDIPDVGPFGPIDN